MNSPYCLVATLAFAALIALPLVEAGARSESAPTGELVTGWHGASVQLIPSEHKLGGFNALVKDVVPGSPAAEAGLEPGDVIWALNRRGGGGEAAWRDQLMQTRLSEKVTVDFTRDGENKQIKIKVVQLPRDLLLVRAARYGDVKQLKRLIAEGADVNARDPIKRTPLHWAAIGGHKNIAERLIAAGSEMDPQDADLRTPLQWATTFGHRDVVELLIARGANMNTPLPGGDTLLHTAAATGREDIVVLLLKKGIGINRRNDSGQTPLHMATYWGDLDIVKMFIANGADTKASDQLGRTALHSAVSQPAPDLAQLLIANGADVNVTTAAMVWFSFFPLEASFTPLHIAAAADHREVVDVLLEPISKLLK